MTSDTRSKKPITRMTARLRSRDFSRCHRPRPLLASTLQMTLSADCSSPKTAVAGDDQCADADRGRNDPGPSAAGTPQHGLHGCSTLRTNEVRKLAEERTFRGLLPKGETSNCDHHDQHGRQREYRVIRDCSPHRWGSVVEPLVSGFLA